MYTRFRREWLFLFTDIFPTFIPVVRFFKMDYFDKDNLDFFIRHCQAMIEDRKTRVSQVYIFTCLLLTPVHLHNARFNGYMHNIKAV